MRPIVVQTPQVTSDTSALQNTFDSVGQSMLQLARAQDQTNRQLQQHIQARDRSICKLILKPYSNLLPLPIKEISIIYLQVYPYMMEVIGKVSFLGLNVWKQHAITVEETLKQKLWVGLQGPVQNVIMALPNARSWRPIREELKRCFSDQTSLGHAAAQ